MLTGNKRRTHVEACVPKPQCRPVGQANSYSLMLMNIAMALCIHENLMVQRSTIRTTLTLKIHSKWAWMSHAMVLRQVRSCSWNQKRDKYGHYAWGRIKKNNCKHRVQSTWISKSLTLSTAVRIQANGTRPQLWVYRTMCTFQSMGTM